MLQGGCFRVMLPGRGQGVQRTQEEILQSRGDGR